MKYHWSHGKLKNSVDFCVTVGDDQILKLLKCLQIVNLADEKIVGGECSAPGIISLIASCNNSDVKKKLDINMNSNILLIGCEGNADEESL